MTHDSEQGWNDMLALDFSLLYSVFVNKRSKSDQWRNHIEEEENSQLRDISLF